MTTSGSSRQYMVTKNTKFESKLARYLISKPGDQLLGYDACLEKQGKAVNYRLMVLGLESIYLPDNPPKPTQLEKPFIHYRDILRAEIIYDYPEFLLGEERTNSMHMRLRVMMPSNKTKQTKQKTKSINADEMETIPSLFNQFTLENIYSYMEPITPRSSRSTRNLNKTPLPQLSAAIPLLLTASSTTTDGYDALASSGQQTIDSLDSRAFNSSLTFKEPLEDLNLNTDRSRIQNLLITPRVLQNTERGTTRSKSAKSSSKKKGNNDSDWNPNALRFNRYALRIHQDDRYGTLHTPRSTPRSHGNDDMLLTARSALTDLSYTGSISLGTANNEESSIYCPSVEEVRSLRDDVEEDMRDIDIYFLTLTSKIPEILSAALSNYIVIATLRYQSDPEFSTVSNNCLKDPLGTTLIKFSDLANEILQAHKRPNQLIVLTEELYRACDKYSKVKELFWKDHDLLSYYISQLNFCSQAILNDNFDDQIINLLFSIMQLLNEVFLNTFASTERLARLSEDRCSSIESLVDCLLLPSYNIVPTRTTFDDAEFNELLNKKYRILLKWTIASTSLLWHISDMLRRPSWTEKAFRFRHFIESFEKLQHKDDYFALFVDALSKLIMTKAEDPLSPEHSLYVYQFFSILSLLLVNSRSLSQYIHDQYIEDFKYFLKEDTILSKIPVQYPVYRFIPELIRSVHHRILYGEPDTNTTERTKHHQLI